VDGIVHIIVVVIMKNIDKRVDRTNDIIGNGVVGFVFSDLGGYRPPKSEEGEEIFNVKHNDGGVLLFIIDICLYFIR